jgi:hypothetical protein
VVSGTYINNVIFRLQIEFMSAVCPRADLQLLRQLTVTLVLMRVINAFVYLDGTFLDVKRPKFQIHGAVCLNFGCRHLQGVAQFDVI